MGKNFLFFVIGFFLVLTAYSQVVEPVKWEFRTQELDENKIQLIFEASIEPKWSLYGINIPENGPVPTSFSFNETDAYELIGSVEQVTQPRKKHDPNFDMEVELFSGQAVFQQIVLIKEHPASITGEVEFMSCDDKSCLPPTTLDFRFNIGTGQEQAKREKEAVGLTGNDDTGSDEGTALKAVEPLDLTKSTFVNDEKTEDEPVQASRSLWFFIIISFLAGLAGILTPCVFPMIPMTVSFFMRGSKSRMRSFIEAGFFGASIILIYTLIGIIVSLTSVSANFAQQLSTHWIPNLIFFVLFLAFAVSFLGAFEIMLPGALVNQTDKQVDKGGYWGAFFMAVTLVLVSFSCTGPIVGALLVEAAGSLAAKPIIGMFAFGLAFALPFTLLAAFPSALNKLPKSGGWLNAVKVVLAFIILAFGLKFLSNIDQAYHLNILPRQVFLALWIGIFIIMGMYLLGKVRMVHDSDLKHVSITRVLLAIVTFAFVVYLIPGMFGAPLKMLEPLLPPKTNMDYFSARATKTEIRGDSQTATYCGGAKYTDRFHLPYGIKGYYDLDQGLACAKKLDKPVFIDFTAHTCSNCKEMKAKVWSDPRIQERLKKDFVVISLYVDDKTKLPEEKWVKSTYDGEFKKTLGKKNADIQITKYKANTQPYYVITDAEANKLLPAMKYSNDIEKMIDFLDEGSKKYNKGHL